MKASIDVIIDETQYIWGSPKEIVLGTLQQENTQYTHRPEKTTQYGRLPESIDTKITMSLDDQLDIVEAEKSFSFDNGLLSGVVVIHRERSDRYKIDNIFDILNRSLSRKYGKPLKDEYHEDAIRPFRWIEWQTSLTRIVLMKLYDLSNYDSDDPLLQPEQFVKVGLQSLDTSNLQQLSRNVQTTSSTPFTVEQLEPQTFLKRLFGIPVKKNSIIEIRNLLAKNDPFDINIDDVLSISERYKVNLQKDYLSEVLSIYETYLRFVLQDKNLSDQELLNLSRLKYLFALTDKQISAINEKVVEEVYHKATSEVLADGIVSDAEREFLRKLQIQLKISQEIEKAILEDSKKTVFDSKLASAIADERLSPEEVKELDSLVSNLGIEVSFDEPTKKKLAKYRFFWLVENEGPPEIKVNINLLNEERCFLAFNCDWYEHRKVRVGVNYAGPAMRAKIAKGLYWRAGSLAVSPISRDELTLIDSGKVYLTNKRLIFSGTNKSMSIRLTKVLDFSAYKDGVFIQKDTGKSPFLGFQDNIDVFCVMMGRLLRDV